MEKNKTISIIGLGKLGFPLAVCLAAKGVRVNAVDIDGKRVKDLSGGLLPFYEPGLKKLFLNCIKRIDFTTDLKKAVTNSDITFIVVPTPSKKDGNFSTKYVLNACREIGLAIKAKSGFHLIVITSTVTPGTMEEYIKPALENYSGKKCGQDFGLCYNPEFIALGSIIHNLYNPDFILIGESDKASGDMLGLLYNKFCDNNPSVAKMNFVNAELTKLLVNTFVTMKISYTNMIAHFCSLLPGGDVDMVTNALGRDTRIGSKYLKGGLGYGGPCFPRDNRALSYTADKIGMKATLAEATDRLNKEQLGWLTSTIVAKLPNNGKVGILGLSYKPNTNVVEKSQGFLLARNLIAKGISVILYDPIASREAAREIKNKSKTTFASSMKECIRLSDIIVIAVPWDEFRKIAPAHFKSRKPKQILIDCWRILEKERFNGRIDYIALGVAP